MAEHSLQSRDLDSAVSRTSRIRTDPLLRVERLQGFPKSALRGDTASLPANIWAVEAPLQWTTSPRFPLDSSLNGHIASRSNAITSTTNKGVSAKRHHFKKARRWTISSQQISPLKTASATQARRKSSVPHSRPDMMDKARIGPPSNGETTLSNDGQRTPDDEEARASSPASSDQHGQPNMQTVTLRESYRSAPSFSLHSKRPAGNSPRVAADDDSESESEDKSAQIARAPGYWNSESPTPAYPLETNGAPPDSDPMVQRLQDQEEEMRQHILHSPQPLRFQRPAVTAPYDAPPTWSPYGHPLMGAPPMGYPYYQYGYEPLPPSPHQESKEQATTAGKESPILAGYDLLASKLSETSGKDSIQPLYRRFDKLNHRILLHLQDEICELEEELRQLDQAIASVNRESEKCASPTQSRRQEAQSGSQLHHRRTELLGKIFVKLGQYNKAMKGYLAAFPYPPYSTNNPTRRWRPMRVYKDWIRKYREWLELHAPIAAGERQFLQDEGDLISLPPRTLPASFPPVDGAELCMLLFSLIIISLLCWCLWMVYDGTRGCT